jgi:hypothetical protein
VPIGQVDDGRVLLEVDDMSIGSDADDRVRAAVDATFVSERILVRPGGGGEFLGNDGIVGVLALLFAETLTGKQWDPHRGEVVGRNVAEVCVWHSAFGKGVIRAVNAMDISFAGERHIVGNRSNLHSRGGSNASQSAIHKSGACRLAGISALVVARRQKIDLSDQQMIGVKRAALIENACEAARDQRRQDQQDDGAGYFDGHQQPHHSGDVS